MGAGGGAQARALDAGALGARHGTGAQAGAGERPWGARGSSGRRAGTAQTHAGRSGGRRAAGEQGCGRGAQPGVLLGQQAMHSVHSALFDPV